MTGIRKYLDREVSIAPLVSFRIIFGLLMFFSILRFWWRGWVTAMYIQPGFHFSYWGFEWVKPLGATGMHILFLCMALAALFIALGLFFRVSSVVFFLTFTYVELIDITTYLNHYYFISLVAFILIWLPANRDYALDMRIRPEERRKLVPAWTIGILKFQLAIVYVFAGLAKLNADWLLNAEPMKTWLPSKSHLPLIGKLMYEDWMAYLFSWFGAAYDLFIVFFLLNKKTRPVAYIFVLVFHVATAIFFPAIGMFPYVMIACSLIFFSGESHKRFLSRLPFYVETEQRKSYNYYTPQLFRYTFGLYVFFQLIIPIRFLLYPGHLFWTEQGYRFSWRVMLMEKAGYADFTVKDGNASFHIDNKKYLTPIQEKMMSTQPDMILKFAHFLADQYRSRGIKEPAVFAEVYVTLNGERSKLFIDTSVNLAKEKIGFHHYNWVLPFNSNSK